MSGRGAPGPRGGRSTGPDSGSGLQSWEISRVPAGDRPVAAARPTDREPDRWPRIHSARHAPSRTVREFLLEPGFYNYQGASAFFLLPPPRIDARDYDVVLVDTPTRVAIRRGPNAKVVCVVHDLLPLTDLKLSDIATRLFLSRIVTSLCQADELAFVSNYSRNRFRTCCRNSRTCRRGSSIPAPVSTSRLPHGSARRGAPGPDFVIIVSNEPRKNLATVIRAFRRSPRPTCRHRSCRRPGQPDAQPASKRSVHGLYRRARKGHPDCRGATA